VLTLALDTTTRAGSVAVVRDMTVLALVPGDATRTHGERLPAEIERAMEQAGVRHEDLQLLVVASGPGAFTGLRIGLAGVQGIAMVLALPAIAVSALDALALAATEGTVPGGGDSPRRVRADVRTTSGGTVPSRGDSPLAVGADVTAIATWMDAARGEVFAAFYPIAPPVAAAEETLIPQAVSVPIVATPDDVLDTIPAIGRTLFIGDGAVQYGPQILQRGGASDLVVPAPRALAPHIAYIGMVRAARGEAGPPHTLQPLYVRRPDAELERQRREAR
jgi:tRNA threonylcarbamoyladenosine biosynthesis protein TsaB